MPTLYGPVAVTTPTPATDDGAAVAFSATSMSVYATLTGGSPVSGLYTVSVDGTPGQQVTSISPDPNTGAASWFILPDDGGTLFLEDPVTLRRWPVQPTFLAERIPTDIGYSAPPGGIPQADLDAATEAKLNSIIPTTLIDARGDLIVGTAADTPARLPAAGAENMILMTDPTGSLGVRWASASLFQAAAGANVWWMPIWDGVGAHPTRPVGLPASSFVKWRQPTAPLVGSSYSKPGDEWLATA